MVAYVYAADRKTERPEAHVHGSAGILQFDGYSDYTVLARRHQQIRLAFCWEHVRRKFYELAESSPVAVERDIRPLALNRKNGLFAGSDEGGDNWAVIATLIENCKLAGINPHTWLTATLSSFANGQHTSRINELLPYPHVS
jgi:hypothetical protein